MHSVSIFNSRFVATRLHNLGLIIKLEWASCEMLGGFFSEKNSIKNEHLMKTCSLIVVGAVFMVFSQVAGASYADDITITITGHTAGATPFISNLTLEVSNTTVLKSIQFAIDPKPGSVTRPLSGTYANSYLMKPRL